MIWAKASSCFTKSTPESSAALMSSARAESPAFSVAFSSPVRFAYSSTIDPRTTTDDPSRNTTASRLRSEKRLRTGPTMTRERTAGRPDRRVGPARSHLDRAPPAEAEEEEVTDAGVAVATGPLDRLGQFVRREGAEQLLEEDAHLQ